MSSIVIRQSSGPLDTPWGVQLRNIEDRIRTVDEKGLISRWEFGRQLLAKREGKKLLPTGLLDEVSRELGVSRQELGARMKFAEIYPTSDELSNAIRKFGSWYEIVRSGLHQPKSDSPSKRSVVVKEFRLLLRRVRKQLAGVHASDLTEKDLQVLDVLQEEIARIYSEIESE